MHNYKSINVTKEIYKKLIIFHKYIYDHSHSYDSKYDKHVAAIRFRIYDSDFILRISNPYYYHSDIMTKKDLIELKKNIKNIIILCKQKRKFKEKQHKQL